MHLKKALWLIALPLLLLTSCGGDSPLTPVKPEDETKNKLHDDPRIVEYTLTKGSLSGTTFTPNNDGGGSYLKDKQVIRFSVQADGKFALDSKSPQKAFILIPNQDYLLEIEFMDAKGSSIVHQFLTNGQEKIHQFFFRPRAAKKNDGTTLTKAEELKLFEYTYLDQLNGKLLGTSEPVGFRGALRLTQGEIEIEWRSELYHFNNGTKLDRNLGLRPFNQPTPWQRQVAAIDFTGYTMLYAPVVKGYTWGSNTSQDEALLTALTKAFGIDRDAAKSEAESLF